MDEGISLSELAAQITEGLERTLEPTYWVVAEISEIQVNRTGHCFLELIEKPEREQNPTAKMRAVVWANTYRMLGPYFESETGSELTVGMKILVQVSVSFHAMYGFSLVITDINPTYTVGEDEQRRIKIIRQLEEDGVMDLNKEIPMALVPQRVAIISSSTAAGYQDFMQQLQQNKYGIVFQTQLFPAAMQGADVEATIVAQLDEIYKRETDFDVVVIIRGGGARTDLRWFDSYAIAANVAQFPLPVITGIGHDKDQSITDMVANTSLKTPTAVAEFLIDECSAFVEQLAEVTYRIETAIADELQQQTAMISDFQARISQSLKFAIVKTNNTLSSFGQKITHVAQLRLSEQQSGLLAIARKVQELTEKRLLQARTRLQVIETSIVARNPENILKQGYTFTANAKGEMIRSRSQVQAGDVIITHFSDGQITSEVQ